MGELSPWPPDSAGLDGAWAAVWVRFLRSPEGLRLVERIAERRREGARIFPVDPLRALRVTPAHRACVVIVGQDPYHGPGQAEGLAFSVGAGMRIPPSLRNIFLELGVKRPGGSLLAWARRGVLLLNSCLTVEEGRAGSHASWGWEALTDALLTARAADSAPCVYLLWGAHAHSKRPLLEAAGGDTDARLILMANHPSPLSARRGPTPFLGCGHFETARRWLAGRGLPDPFQWDEAAGDQLPLLGA